MAAGSAPVQGVVLSDGHVEDQKPEANGTEGNEPDSPVSPSRQTTKVEEGRWAKLQAQYSDTGEARGPREYWVDATKFNLIIGGIILLNAVSIGVETDICMGEVCEKTCWDPPAGELPRTDCKKDEAKVFEIIEILFCIVWLFEMFSRMYYHKHRYFFSGWNIMDFLLVVLSVSDAFILPNLEGEAVNLRMLSVLRVVRLMRLVRLIRLLRIFKELWLLVNGFIESMRVLGWIVLLLSLLIYISAILMTIAVGETCSEYEPGVFGGFNCEDMFGGIGNSMYTLFQVLTLESWSMAVVRPIKQKMPGLIAFFLAFLFLTTFGLMNIVVGVIVENTLEAAKQNEDKIRKRASAESARTLAALRNIFEEADEDGSGTVDIDEFRNIVKREDVASKFRMLELPTEEAEELFHILDEEGTGELDIETFISGTFKLKGAAKAKDLMGVVVATRSISRRVDRIETRVQEVIPLVQELPQRIEEAVREVVQRLEGRRAPAPPSGLPGADRGDDDDNLPGQPARGRSGSPKRHGSAGRARSAEKKNKRWAQVVEY